MTPRPGVTGKEVGHVALRPVWSRRTVNMTMEEWVADQLAKSPPLTQQQIERVKAILSGSRLDADEAA